MSHSRQHVGTESSPETNKKVISCPSFGPSCRLAWFSLSWGTTSSYLVGKSSVCETQPCFPPLAFCCKFGINKLPPPCCYDTDGNTSGADKCVTTPVSSPQISHPQLHFHISCWVLFHLLLSFLSYLIRQCQSHPLSNPVLPLFVTGCRSTSQWHVEFFITSPRGHHAACACVSCCFFFQSCLLSLSLSHSCTLILSPRYYSESASGKLWFVVCGQPSCMG